MNKKRPDLLRSQQQPFSILHAGHYIMCDIETLDTAPSAKIGAIAIAVSDGQTIVDRLELLLDLSDQQTRTSSVYTKAWWAKQPVEVRNYVFGGKLSSLAAAQQLAAFLQPWAKQPDCLFIGKGYGFDWTILKHWLAEHNIAEPWHFRALVDLRTLDRIWQAPMIGKATHRPMDDVEQQIAALHRQLDFFQKLMMLHSQAS